MKRIAALALIALVAALAVGPATASSPKRLTVHRAQMAAREMAKNTIAALLYRSVGSAPVKVTDCKVTSRRGRCRVTVSGTSHCTYVAHILNAPTTWVVWGDQLRCS